MTHPASPRSGQPKSATATRRAPARQKTPSPGVARGATDARTVRVLCVDDHTLVVEGLRAQFAIAGDIEVVEALPTADTLVEAVGRVDPDVVLLDIEMPGADAFETADRVRQLHPRTKVLVLSAHTREQYISAAYRCGASGYFAKGDDLEAIVEGVREVARSRTGTFVLGPKVRERFGQLGGALPAVDSDSPPKLPKDRLSPREVEVLRLIGKGFSRGQIASELGRSVKTVDGHQERLLGKLGLHSRAELLRYALREGFAEA